MLISLNDNDIDFIKSNFNQNVHNLFLKYVNDEHKKYLIEQISIRQKISKKLPFLIDNYKFIFPSKLSYEQSSSEKTAKYKSEIIDYKFSADLTGGLGIDTFFISKKSDKHFYIEQNQELCEIFKHNATELNLQNIEILNENAENFIKNTNEYFDLIYLDPNRRADSGQKMYFLEHSSPNILNMLDDLKRICDKVLIKTSPLLDISLAVKELKYVSEVHILSIENECKELLFLIDFKEVKELKYFAVNFEKNNEQILIIENKDEIANYNYAIKDKFLYEPNSSIMKLVIFDKICRNYNDNIFKISKNSHLFTSNNYFGDFPGRIFEIISIVKFSKKEILTFCKDRKANISLRNFPISVEEFKKKIGLKDGGDIYIFGTTETNNKPIIFITKKIIKK